MKERPILFSAPMVRAILQGKKTQTRRIVKPQPPAYIDELHGNQLRKRAPYQLECEETGGIIGHGFFDDNDRAYKCPYGVAGDRLWVREAWRHGYPVVCSGPSMNIRSLQFRADYGSEGDYVPWKPSIHMPRWASRITLEVVAVRVERLQDITEENAIAEGAQCAGVPASLTNRGAFAKLWESINGADSWNANPWVWVVEFKQLEDGAS